PALELRQRRPRQGFVLRQRGHRALQQRRGLPPALQSHERPRQPELKGGVVAFNFFKLLQLPRETCQDAVHLKHQRFARRALFFQPLAPRRPRPPPAPLVLQQPPARPEAIQARDGVVPFSRLEQLRSQPERE